MQIGIVSGGSLSTFDEFLYPEQRDRDREFFRREAYSAFEHLTDRGREFMDRAKKTYEHFHDGRIARAARALLRNVRGMTRPNVIQRLVAEDDIRNAPPAMIRYIMACPEIRTSYLKQRVDGYGDEYYNAFADKIGHMHYDYRRATNGMVEFFIDEQGNENFRSTSFLDELLDDDRELDLEEKVDIKHTWEFAVAAIQKGIDVTDKSKVITEE